MAASYPGTKRAFTTRADTTDVVFASHMNDAQDEIRAIQDTVGTNPHISTAGGGSSFGAWSGATRTYQTLADRLANIEAGLVADTHTQYARLASTETFTGTKTFSATQTFFGAATGTTSGQVFLSSGTTGGEASLFWRDGTTSRWALYRVAGGNELHLRDMVNARHHVSFAPGVGNTAASTLFGSNLTVGGNTTLQGTLGVTGATTLAALTLSGALTLATGTGATPTDSRPGDAAAGGTSTAVARADHRHGRETIVIRVPHTFAVPGDIMLASDQDNVIPGFYLPVPAGQTAVLAAARHSLGAGTATITLNRNGTAVPGAAPAVTVTPTTTDFADVAAADGDYITITASALGTGAGVPKNLSFTIYVDYKVG